MIDPHFPFLTFGKKKIEKDLDGEERHLDLILCLGCRVSYGSDRWTKFVNRSIGFDQWKDARRADVAIAARIMSAIANQMSNTGSTFLVLPMIGSKKTHASDDDPVTKLATAFRPSHSSDLWHHTTTLLRKKPHTPLHKIKAGKKARLDTIRNTHSLSCDRKSLKTLGADQIYLVDDIVTLGSTMNDAARAIRETGGYDGHIIGVALAKHILSDEPVEESPFFDWIRRPPQSKWINQYDPGIERDLLEFCR